MRLQNQSLNSITEYAETIAESITHYELNKEAVNTINSVTGLNIEENKPVKNVKYVGKVDIHHASIHEGVTYPCDSCNYRPATKGHLSRHIKAVHDGIV